MFNFKRRHLAVPLMIVVAKCYAVVGAPLFAQQTEDDIHMYVKYCVFIPTDNLGGGEESFTFSYASVRRLNTENLDPQSDPHHHNKNVVIIPSNAKMGYYCQSAGTFQTLPSADFQDKSSIVFTVSSPNSTGANVKLTWELDHDVGKAKKTILNVLDRTVPNIMVCRIGPGRCYDMPGHLDYILNPIGNYTTLVVSYFPSGF